MLSKKRIMLGIIPLAAMCIFASAGNAKAEDTETSATQENYGSYKVEIPSEVTVNSSGEGTLPVNATLDTYCELDIEIRSANNYKLQPEYNSESSDLGIDYSISSDNNFSDTSEKIISFSNPNPVNGSQIESETNINIKVTGEAKACGVYKDTLTFTMDYRTKRPESDSDGSTVNPEEFYVLTFDANGGSVDRPNALIKSGMKYGTLPVPTREGYKFEGWYTDATNGTVVSTGTIMGNSNASIYAHWQPNTLIINYHNGGADYIKWDGKEELVNGTDVSYSSTDKYGENFSNGQFGLYDVWRWKRIGYTAEKSGNFWRVGNEGNRTCSAGDIDPATTICMAEQLGVLDDLKKGDVTVDLYPIWTPNTYEVSYNANCEDASGATVNSCHTYDAEQSLTLNGFSRTGYTFAGWNTEANGTGTSYEDGARVKNLTEKDNGIITLHAQWKPDSSNSDSENPSTEEDKNDSENTTKEQQKEESADDNESTDDRNLDKDTSEKDSIENPSDTEGDQQQEEENTSTPDASESKDTGTDEKTSTGDSDENESSENKTGGEKSEEKNPSEGENSENSQDSENTDSVNDDSTGNEEPKQDTESEADLKSDSSADTSSSDIKDSSDTMSDTTEETASDGISDVTGAEDQPSSENELIVQTAIVTSERKAAIMNDGMKARMDNMKEKKRRRRHSKTKNSEPDRFKEESELSVSEFSAPDEFSDGSELH